MPYEFGGDGFLPASIRYNNPGAMYPGPSADRFGSTGYGTIGGGNLIARFPDAESGAAAQFDLLNRNYTGMTLSDAINKWSGGHDSRAYVNAVSQQTGLDPDAVLTPELMANPDIAIPLAQSMAKIETGRDYPLNQAGWQAAYTRALSDTEIPIQAQNTSFSGNRGMADTSRGMLGILDPTAPREDTRPQGLLGSLSDPESIAYMAMIAKAFNPWSQMNPEQLLIQAQRTRESQAQRAMDRYYKDAELRLRQQEYIDKRQTLEQQRQAIADVFGGGQPQPSPMPAAPINQTDQTDQTGGEAAPLGLGPAPPQQAASPPQGFPLTANIAGRTLDLPQIQRALGNQYLDPTMRQFLQREYDRLTSSQKISQDFAEKRRIAELPKDQGGAGLEKDSPEYQQFVYGIKPTEKAVPPVAASSLAAANTFLNAAPKIEKAINNGELTGFLNSNLAAQGIGEKGTYYRAIEGGIRALRQRGRAVDPNEFLPTMRDTEQSMLEKYKALKEELESLQSSLLRGRGSSGSGSPFGMQGGSLPEGWTVKVRP